MRHGIPRTLLAVALLGATACNTTLLHSFSSIAQPTPSTPPPGQPSQSPNDLQLQVTGNATTLFVGASFALQATLPTSATGCQACITNASTCDPNGWIAAQWNQGSCSLPPTSNTAATGTVLTLALRATDANGLVLGTAPGSRTSDLTPPTITNLLAGRLSRSQLQFTWNANDTASGLGTEPFSLSYGLNANDANSTPSVQASEGPSPLRLQQQSTTLSGLSQCNRYYVNLVATDAVGNRSPSIPLSVSAGCGASATYTMGEYDGDVALLSMIVTDLDGDGAPDVAMAKPDGFYRVRWADSTNGRGHGTFDANSQEWQGPVAPVAIAAADFNGDGIPDLALAGGNVVFISLGSGGEALSSFTPPASGYGVPPAATAIAVADFNGDHILDIACVGTSGMYGILLGNGSNGVGDGTFGTVTTGSAGPSNALAAADFDRDGNQDLVITSTTGPGALLFLHGHGNGTFTQSQSYSIGTANGANPNSLAVGDFNHDAILDVAIANQGTGTVTILLGTGQATTRFAEPQLYPVALGPVGSVGAGPTGIATSDLNDDGILDLAVSHEGTSVGVLLGGGSNGQGDGTFGTQQLTATGLVGSAIAAADLNGDGIVDLVQGGGNNTANPNNFGVILGNGAYGSGTGALLPLISMPTEISPGLLLTGDVNADSIDDIVMLALAGVTPGGFQVMLGGGGIGQGVGEWVGQAPVLQSQASWGGALADVNGDGILDVIFANGDGNISVATGAGTQGRGNGQFNAVQSWAASQNAQHTWWASPADFNGDGIADIAIADNGANQLTVLLGASGNIGGASPSFTMGTTVAVPNTAPVFVVGVDLNDDGITDLLSSSLNANNVQVTLGTGSSGRGNGSFAGPVGYGVGTQGTVYLSVTDMNGDGMLDIVAAGYDGTVGMLLGQTTGHHAAGTFQNNGSFRACSPGPATVLKVLDLNGDAVPDVVTLCGNGIAVLLGNGSNGRGNGTLGTATVYPLPGSPSGLIVADVDDDGLPDVVVSDSNGGVLHLLFGTGTYP